MREGVTEKETSISRINNFNKEINPIVVTSGNFDNTSFDASNIINPIIAGNYLLLFFKIQLSTNIV
jgi:hypothetical protein